LAEPGLIEPAGAVSRESFLAELRLTADRAADAAGGYGARDFLIAGHRVRILFAGDTLVAPLTEALAHLRVESRGEASLTIRVWDRAARGVDMPSPPWGHDDYREHGVVRGWFDEEVQVVYQWNTHSVSVLRPREGEGMFWVRDAAEFPWFDRAAPLRKLLHLWLSAEGLQPTHGAAVAGGAGCVLLVGRSGAGKSSATLACLSSEELGHIGEDYCVLEVDAEDITAHSLYSSAKAHAETMSRLGLDPAMVANPVRPADEKAVFFLGEHAPDQLVHSAPLRAIAIPVVTGERDTRLVPAGRGAALGALAPSTMLQLPGTGDATMSKLAAIVRAVPAFRLEAGTDPEQVAPVLAELLRR
jgi:hypothetical protein